MLAERGIDVTYETVRRWALKFGTIIARRLRRGRPRPSGRWHLDEVFVSINGRQLYVWRAVDSEGEVLDILVQPRRDRKAAIKLMRKLLKKQGIAPATIVTDMLRSYSFALRVLDIFAQRSPQRPLAEQNHLGQALLFYRSDPALRIGIQIRTARRQHQWFDPA